MTVASSDAGPGGAPGRPVDLDAQLQPALEALLVVVEEPASVDDLAAALQAGPEVVTSLLERLRAAYEAEGRGFELREGPQGWRLYSRPEHADVVERLVSDARHAKLTQAALETLAIVAYRQPVSRSRVAAIRGVGVDAVMRTLASRGLVREVGLEGPTGATLYGTTELFLERLGLTTLDELPDVADLVPDLETLDDVDG